MRVSTMIRIGPGANTDSGLMDRTDPFMTPTPMGHPGSNPFVPLSSPETALILSFFAHRSVTEQTGKR